MKNKGKIVRSIKKDTNGFTPIDNSILQSKTLTSNEIHLLIHLISLPPDWVIIKGIFYKRMNTGRDRVNKAWKSLEDKGYIKTDTIKKGNLIEGYFHTVYENPLLDNPSFGITNNQSVQNTVNIQTNNIQTNNIQTNNINSSILGKKVLEGNSLNMEIYKKRKIIMDTNPENQYRALELVMERELDKLTILIGEEKFNEILPTINEFYELTNPHHK
jgi:hypothetical protein